MISERQLEANRRNAAKSHGPTTPEGRAAVRHNALKHGFTAAEIVLPTVEEQIDFEQFRAAFEEEHRGTAVTLATRAANLLTQGKDQLIFRGADALSGDNPLFRPWPTQF